MRKVLLFAIALLFGYCSFASDAFSVKYSQTNESDRQLIFTLGEYSIGSTNINNQNFSTIVFDHSVTTMQKGWAELPYLSSSV